jgi:hypothetical protein
LHFKFWYEEEVGVKARYACCEKFVIRTARLQEFYLERVGTVLFVSQN